MGSALIGVWRDCAQFPGNGPFSWIDDHVLLMTNGEFIIYESDDYPSIKLRHESEEQRSPHTIIKLARLQKAA